ncbi:hypothetical protein HF289_17715 [Acidithiobacillus ferrooxidans]|jgi:hypothetical protein|uniref:hypothetical protein n=1 Tax=Acidithiobacillus ferrooxidans TaxID=920 RepID=UPI001C07B97A|nr:hypothetical protein [Acidithiobacillus ferrooxidans]MBU2858615.1 hypothetical protein [Acidithiobacillus ferrooxidans]MBU2859074.1 hypothetical protein [Acidithiobacillus ferrooxidans]MCR2830617.1 hypothetical protein [Acidithiobacillus ferrooxidans]
MDYIAQIEGDYYEGTNVKLRLMISQPLIFPFRLESSEPAHEHIFVEDYFNSSTRIRRGRVYKQSSYKSWSIDRITPRPLSWNQTGPDIDKCPANINASFEAGATLALMPGNGVVLGKGTGESHWIAVLAEQVISYGFLVTLKSKTFLGVLPALIPDKIPEKNREDIIHALDDVVDTASIRVPPPVIDACRNAASHMISAKFPESNPNGKADLGPLVKWLIDQSKLKKCTDAADSLLYLLEASTSHLVNQLHSRGKANAAAAHGTRPVSQRDADLAVSAIAFLLQDFGWAANEG